MGCRGYRLVANSRAAKQRKCSSLTKVRLTKVRLLPFQKVVVVFEYFKLLNFAGTATIEDNEATLVLCGMSGRQWSIVCGATFVCATEVSILTVRATRVSVV